MTRPICPICPISPHSAFGRRLLILAVTAGALSQCFPARAQEQEAGHRHGLDGRHIAVAETSAGAAGKSILSHHDLKITDTSKFSMNKEGALVEGCDVHSVIHKKGDPTAVVHREHNAYEAENGVYGSHMMYKEPGEYVIIENVTMPDGKKYTLEFPIWVPGPSGGKEGAVGFSSLVLGVGGAAVAVLILTAFLLGRRSGRQAAAGLSVLALLGTFLPRGAWAQEGREATGGRALTAEGFTPSATAPGEAGHMHGPDGRHIAVAETFGGKPGDPLRAFLGPNREIEAFQTKDQYRFRLSIENEELAPPDPDVVTLAPAAAKAVGLQVAAVREQRLAGGLVTTGQVRPNPNGVVAVSPRVAGRVARVNVTPGQRVPAGSVVAVVDSTEIAEAQAALVRAQAEQRQAEAALARARAEVRRTQSHVAEAQAELDRARADLGAARGRAEHSRKTLERQRQLAAAGAFAQGPVEEARSTVTAAEGELASAQTALANLEAQARRMEQGLRDGVVARKEWEVAQAAAEQGRTRATTARQQLEIARAALAREERIQSQGLRNAREVQQAEADLETAQLAVRSAEAVVASQTRALQAARAQVDAAQSGAAEATTGVARARSSIRTALNRLQLLGAIPGGSNQVAVRTPIGGEVQSRPVNAGEVVAPGQTLCTILNAASVWVESNIFEKELPRVRAGQRVAIVADAVPGRTFQGTVGYIGGEVNPETRAVRVRTVVPNPDERLKPNMFVRVMIGAGTGTTLTVPVEALHEEGGEQLVFVQEATGAYRRRQVRVGASLGDQVVVETGLKPGERVVTQGSYQLLAESRKG
jgi:RND family efflux transporter MFP subunit